MNRSRGLARTFIDPEGDQSEIAIERGRIVRAYEFAKERIATALASCVRVHHFGVRQEYRMTLVTFSQMEFDDDDTMPSTPNSLWSLAPPTRPSDRPSPGLGSSSSSVGERQCHRPYWILPTELINRFQLASLNRFVYALEAIMSQSVKGNNGLAVASPRQQEINGVMVSALLRTLRLCLGGSVPASRPEIWRREWRAQRRPTHCVDDPPPKRYGLGLQDIVQARGFVAFPPEMIQWHPLPQFERFHLRRLALAKQNTFHQTFKHRRNIAPSLQRDNAIMDLLIHDCEEFRATFPTPLPSFKTWKDSSGEALGNIIWPYTQLIISSYIETIVELIIQRTVKDTNTAQRERKQLTDRLHTIFEERNVTSTQGLSYAAIQGLIRCPIRIAMARTSAVGTGRQSYFSRYYNSGKWVDRIRGLFAWDDQPPGRRPRAWENEPFRKLTKKIHFRIDSILGPQIAGAFFSLLIHMAASKLLLIPQYDYDKLSVLYKPSKYHSDDTADAIGAMSSIARMNWLVPRFPHEYDDLVRQVAGREDPPNPTDPTVVELRSLLEFPRPSHKELSKLLETRFDLDGDPVTEEALYYPQRLGWDPTLTYLLDLQDRVDMHLERSDSESTSSDSLSSYDSGADASLAVNDSDLDS